MIRIAAIAAPAVLLVGMIVACGDASGGGDDDSDEVALGGSAPVGSSTGGGSGGADLDSVTSGVGGTLPEPTGGAGPLLGESVYSAPCGAPDDACGEGLTCVPFSLGEEGSVGYACSAQCPNGVEDCANPPAGSSAAIGCWQFTTADRCVLVCEYNGQYFACPSGMTCIRSTDGRVGQCLWAS